MIELNASLEFYDGMKSSDIQKLLIKSATNLILDEICGHVNYQIAAGRLLNQDLRKMVYGQYDPPRLFDIVVKNVQAGMYEPMLLQWYTEAEWDQMEKFIDHKRDENMAVAQIDQLIEKYLVKSKDTNVIYETPQIRYVVAAAIKFHAETEHRMKQVKDEYNFASKGFYTYATPQLAGLGTPTKQFSSCVVIKSGDSLDSIYAAGEAMGKYAAKRAGIGFDMGGIRPKGSPIRNGQVKHTGLVGFIKKWFADLRCCSQGGIRNASATFFYPVWHLEFEDLIVLKNNQGTDDTRVRHLDYGVVLSGFFLKRLKEGKKITLFDPSEVPDLYEAYYRDPKGRFVELYEKYEKSTKIRRKKKIGAEEVFRAIITERNDTGRIYLMFVDNVAAQVPYDTEIYPIYSSNLCMEILLPTRNINSIDDEDALIGLCTLGSMNLGAFKNPKDMERPVRHLVRGLSNVLAYQDFLFPASKRHNDLFRPLGIGITNLAYWMAKRGYKYGQKEANQELKSWMEHILFYSIKESVELAKERGACLGFKDSKWAKGIFPWETRKKAVDTLADFSPDPTLDWEGLRAEMLQYGLHNMNFLAVAPVESSSVVINSTNGMEQPKALVSFKESKTSGSLVQVVPEYHKLKDKYQLMWGPDSDLRGYLDTAAVVGVYVDQSMSTNTKYDPSHYEGKVIPFQVVMDDLIDFYNKGGKTLYYSLVEAQSTNKVETEEDCESCKL
ncbi:ribonucleotide-diphosphate reductase subunit alpha [Ralstonia phage RSP15]|uniref:ribonucleotide reductase large subunit n=1 Tax=Ralstonia phage RSP15 TaxID=1785960 RepID=UPI00074D3037|nr:ribonucleotide reductase large subunit [Ralstonia phage RSP15]BAU40017.1 ribonucleotide-diphosphate reductase subunit alpha [Ralstonia phage RSP15]